ncbi:aminoglycoside 3'-phosphotransferase [Microlunatus elymi]|uniref:Aminoglycoside 3'-phosphotransferase n=1 Tax=Microlunatus elymi TaxID=2596828 RepID=A0A516Q1Y0_9ACTN|nr:aminoglycoside 3'-phosphotransferase [Microlunatus elymi]QDP97445.1 aminoglycoside 3'-phosphotransferase [Microlunatus elymi]
MATSISSDLSFDPDRAVTADEVPPVVADLAAGAPIRWIWANGVHGRTYRIDRGDHTEYVKWGADHEEVDLELEAEKLRWARTSVTVPEVLGVGRDSATSTWMHTAGIPAQSAIAPRWKADPLTAARAIGAGLRRFHDHLPVADCPWSWRIADRATKIKKPEDQVLIEQAPPEDQLVVCHGDACSPNTLIGDDGRCAGHVDLGSLGVGDRWADLAIATYSLSWNFEPANEDELLAAYGVEPDVDRIAYYRRLWDAT